MIKRTVSLLISTLVVLADSAASAQNELDASLQVGSHGLNQPVGTPDFASRNNLIYGLVSGGRGFRQNDRQLGDDDGIDAQWRTGELISPGAFRDVLGSDDLFRFRARSLSFSLLDQSGLGLQNLRNRPVYSGVPPVSAGHVTQNITSALVRQDIASQLVSPVGDAASSSTIARYHTMRTVLDTAGKIQINAGIAKGPKGQLFDLEATPLRGLRAVAPRAAVQDYPPTSTDDASAGTVNSDNSHKNQIEANVAISQPSWAPSVEIGSQMMATINAADMDKFEHRTEELAISLLVVPHVENTTVGDDVFVDLLKQIEIDAGPAVQELDVGLDLGLPDQQAMIDQEPKDVKPDPTIAPLIPKLKLKELGLELVQQAVVARRAAVHSAQGLPAKLVEGNTSKDMGHAPLPPKLNKLVNKLDYDLPRMATMAGNIDTEVNERFRAAEEHMAAGKYFLAEKAYQQVLQFKSGHELAGAGLIHAQLGAAMIRSAARNLRHHFTQHPQLIAMRYQRTLLPSQERLEWVVSKLHTMVQYSKTTNPSLMLAYLGYQTGSNQIAQYGLDIAQSRTPRDPLLPLLRRIWLEEPTESAPPPEPAQVSPVPADEAALDTPDEPEEPRASQ